MNSFPSIEVASQPTVNIVITYQDEAEVNQESFLTNQQALNKIAEYLEKTTAYLRDRRLMNE